MADQTVSFIRLHDTARQLPESKAGHTDQAAAMRIVFIGTALPRRCGIATFTTDLELAMRDSDNVAKTEIIAMSDPDGPCAHDTSVHLAIAQDEPGAYLQAADYINAAGFDVVSLQHEFGIFGGEAATTCWD